MTGNDSPVPQGNAIQSTHVLHAGVHYELLVTGVSYSLQVYLADAQYQLIQSPANLMYGGGIVPGVGVNDSLSGPNRYPYWGPYYYPNASEGDLTNTYAVDFVGTEEPISLNFHDSDYSDDFGVNSTLQVQIFQQLPSTAAPAIPLNLVASAQGTSNINLTWSTATIANAQQYVIYRNSSGTFNAANVLATVPAAASGELQSYTDPLSAGDTTKYYYWVAASNGSGTSGPSNVSSAKLSSNTPVLNQPTSPSPITGTSKSLSVTATDPTNGNAGLVTCIWSVLSAPSGAVVQLTSSYNSAVNARLYQHFPTIRSLLHLTKPGTM